MITVNRNNGFKTPEYQAAMDNLDRKYLKKELTTLGATGVALRLAGKDTFDQTVKAGRQMFKNISKTPTTTGYFGNLSSLAKNSTKQVGRAWTKLPGNAKLIIGGGLTVLGALQLNRSYEAGKITANEEAIPKRFELSRFCYNTGFINGKNQVIKDLTGVDLLNQKVSEK